VTCRRPVLPSEIRLPKVRLRLQDYGTVGPQGSVPPGLARATAGALQRVRQRDRLTPF